MRGRRTKRQERTEARDYVKSLEVPESRVEYIVDAARRFDQQKFLPSGRDIAKFCAEYGLKSGSRRVVVPRVFNYLAFEMSVDEFGALTSGRKYQGVAELGPIARAIREFGQRRRSG